MRSMEKLSSPSPQIKHHLQHLKARIMDTSGVSGGEDDFDYIYDSDDDTEEDEMDTVHSFNSLSDQD